MRLPTALLPLLAALLIPASASAAQVSILRAHLDALRGGAPAKIEAPSPPPSISHRLVAVTPTTTADGDAALLIDARWAALGGSTAWVDVVLAGPTLLVQELTVNGVAAPILTAPDGVHLVTRLAPGSLITLRGLLPGDPAREPVPLPLLAAPSGAATTTLVSATLVPTWTGAPSVFGVAWGGGDLSFALLPPPEPLDTSTLLLGTVGLGLTVSDDAIRCSARVGFAVRRGSLGSVSVAVPGAGRDLDVQGPNVLAWVQQGDRIDVTLRSPSSTVVSLLLTWSSATPTGEAPSIAVPAVAPLGVLRTTSTLQLARDGEIELLPKLRGWSAAAASTLPEWGRDLVVGTPTASFLRGDLPSGSVQLLAYSPISGPEVMIEVADLRLAVSPGGRVLLRARYEVLNDRADVLPITLPPGAQLLAVRVADRAATVTQNAAGQLLVPLRRSIETVQGLLSFPVELALLFDGTPWSRRERRSLPVPAVGAPVAVLRATVHLPPGWSPARTQTLAGFVPEFSRGEGVAYGLKATGGDEDKKVLQADTLFGAAVRAWEDNDFDVAQGLLDELSEVGASNDNVTRLQSNLDLMLGGEDGDRLDANRDGDDGTRPAPEPSVAAPAESAQAVVQARRVKEQAKAKAGKDELAYAEAERDAEESYRAGDYKQAEEKATVALQLGKKLQRLEQSESVEISTRNQALGAVLESVSRAPAASPAPPPPRPTGASGQGGGSAVFGDLERGPLLGSGSGSGAAGVGYGMGSVGVSGGRGVGTTGGGVGYGAIGTVSGGAYGAVADGATTTVADPKPDTGAIAPVTHEPAPLKPPPAITVTNRFVTVPEVGVALRFQHVLLQPGAAPSITVGARADSSEVLR